MQKQQAISARRLKRKVGTRQQVLIDEVTPPMAARAAARLTRRISTAPCM